MNQEICVYILTHNRPDVILRSLNSVREQDYCNLKIIVSDNSDNDETTELLKILQGKIEESVMKKGHRVFIK